MKHIASCLLLAGGFVLAPSLRIDASAEDAKFELKASWGVREILVENAGKKVALTLVSGAEVEGTVTTVGNSLVHVSRLAGKEFYDAVVSIDQIAAVRMRVREK